MKKNRQRTKSIPSGNDAPQQKVRFTQIDILKGLAIIAVVLMHTYNEKLLSAIGAPFYVFQAVPIFLFLAAFNNANALSLLRKKTLAQCYDIAIILRRLKRLLVAYTVIWIVQLVVVFWLLASMIDIQVQNPNHFFYTGIGTVLNFLCGANGPGNYFIPLIVQFIFIVPLFYFLAVRYSPDVMLAVTFVFDLVLECLTVLAGMPEWLYAIAITRYTFMAGLGVWLVFRKRVVTGGIVVAALASAVYIAAATYFGFRIWIFDMDPAYTHAFAFFWTLLLVVLGFQYLPSVPSGPITVAVAELGKASWHIFLVQMTWFFFLGYAYTPLEQSVTVAVILAFFYLVPCLLIGYGFYRLQEYFMGGGKSPAR